MSREVPQRVLPETLAERVGDRRIAAAVFVTYQLEPGFFEDAVLGALFGCESGRGDRVQRALLEDHLRETDVVVFYDRGGLVVDRTPRQSISLVPVSRRHHVLHAKHAFLLLEGGGARDERGLPASMLLLTTSANLTRTGWWENVEVADIEELAQGQATPLKPDLQRLLQILRALDPHNRHDALERTAAFVDALEPAAGVPRLWTGDEPLPEFVAAHLGEVDVARLELFAPFVSEDAAPIHALHDRLRPHELWVRMPVDRDGSPAATHAWRDQVDGIEGARFAELPASVDLSYGRGAVGKRFVHAKVVRVVARDRRAWTLAGSPNLTGPGFMGHRRGNLETAILRAGDPEPGWIRPVRVKPTGAAEPVEAPEARPWTMLRMRVRYDWKHDRASYLLEERSPVEVFIGRAQGADVVLTLVAEPDETWRLLPSDFSAWLRAELATSNVLSVRTGDKEPALLLVEEVERLDRPDFLHLALSPADILRYWSLRDPAAREAHLADLVERTVDGRRADAREQPHTRTMFHSFAGLFHAFLCFREQLLELLVQGRQKAVVVRLLGRGHDALPTLLEKVLADQDTDPVQRLLTLLSAREVVDEVRRRQPALFDEHAEQAAALQRQLDHVDEAWDRLDLTGSGFDPAAFRDWYTASWSAGLDGEAT